MSMNYDGNPRKMIECGKSRTKQALRAMCDINNIVARYNKTGLIDHINKNAGVYSDVSSLRDYPSALRLIKRGRDLFEALPPNIREKFGNDPSQLIVFLDDLKNKKEAIELGLVPKPKQKASSAPPAPTSAPLAPVPTPTPTPTPPAASPAATPAPKSESQP